MKDTENRIDEFDEQEIRAQRGARRWTTLALSIAFVALLGAAASSSTWLDTQSISAPSAAERYTAVPGPSPTRTATATATSSATPTMTPTMTPTPTPAFVEYSVVRGDTMLSVASRFDTSVEILFSVNGLTENDVLSIGQVLRIPVDGEAIEPTAIAPTEVVPTATALPTTVEAVSTPATSTPEPKQTIHTVAAGEHIGIISQLYGVSQTAIAQANGIDVSDILSIGQELIIPGDAAPAPIIHTVAAGEHLGIIARTYGVSQAEIAVANGFQVDAILSIGQQLVIPVEVPQSETEEVSVAEEAPVSTAEAVQATATPEPTATPERVTVHTVIAGEFIEAIAARYDVSVGAILEANSLSSESLLSIGQEIIIPAGGTAATRTPEPTATPLPAVPTPTVVPTLTPVALEAVSYSYPPAYLLGPPDGATFSGPDAVVLLNWTSSGVLASHEWYLVRIWPAGIDQEEIELWTRATSVRLPDVLRPAVGEPDQLLWQVTVVSRYSESDIGTPLSPLSESRTITWR